MAVTVLNTGSASIEVDRDLVLCPGQPTEIDESRFEALTENPAINLYLEHGRISVMDEGSEAVGPVRLGTIAESEPVIAAETDLATLQAWREADDRQGIYARIDARIEELTAS